jgi:hypothetical protein
MMSSEENKLSESPQRFRNAKTSINITTAIKSLQLIKCKYLNLLNMWFRAISTKLKTSE